MSFLNRPKTSLLTELGLFLEHIRSPSSSVVFSQHRGVTPLGAPRIRSYDFSVQNLPRSNSQISNSQISTDSVTPIYKYHQVSKMQVFSILHHPHSPLHLPPSFSLSPRRAAPTTAAPPRARWLSAAPGPRCWRASHGDDLETTDCDRTEEGRGKNKPMSSAKTRKEHTACGHGLNF